MTHAVVTTVDGPYSRYLHDWAVSVAAQTRRPDQVVIVDNGADDPAAVAAAAELAGAEVVRTPWHVNRGRARNIAVAASRTEWVQHFDCDDIMQPWALEHTDPLRDDADVVGWGWERWAEQPVRARTRIYERHRGRQTLAAAGPASGPSPFRRSLWEQAPYRDDMDGAWDTALWLGFARLDARFVPTPEPVFLYRYHDDSIFQTRRRTKNVRVGLRLQQLREDPPPDVCVVVPLRTDDPDRLAAADWLQGWYADRFPGWRWVVADSPGPWNKPRALNDTIAGLDCRTLVVTDGDLFVDPANLEQAVALSAHVPWVVPHETVHRLDRDHSRDVMAGARPDPARCHMLPYRGVDGGGIFVLSRAQWDRTGGMDDTFEGWGAEDEAFAVAANTLLGERVRLDGPLWHLYHDPGPRTRHDRFSTNKARLRQYRAVAGNRPAMRALTGEIIMAGEARYLNTRTNKTVTVEVGSPSWARFERLVAHGRVYVRVSGPDVDTVDQPAEVDQDSSTVDEAPDPSQDDRELRHTGGGWYELVVDGEVVDKVRGRDEAEQALADA